MSQINTNWTQTETPAFIQNKWAEPLGVKWNRSELEQEYQTILCKTENWWEDTQMVGKQTEQRIMRNMIK
jgi:hypothetical protein